MGKFALFITGLLGFGGFLTTFGQFGGVNHQPHRPFGFGQHGGIGGGLGSFGSQHDPISGGYYKAATQHFHEFATTEKDPQFVDSFYNYEKKIMQNKSDKLFDKEPKVVTPTDQTTRANSYRSFVWQTV